MEKSIVNALKAGFESAFIVDFEKNSCEILFSSLISNKYEGRLVSIKVFTECYLGYLDENYQDKLCEFINKSNLRTAYINDKTYHFVYALNVREDSYELYKATMIPQTAETGLICTSKVSENDLIIKAGGAKTVGAHAVFLRLENNPVVTISYANDRLYKNLGYTRQELKEQFNNSFSRIAIDDFEKCLKLCGAHEEKSHYDFNIRLRNKFGKTVWMHCICAYDKDENVYTAVMIDITNQIKMNQEARVKDEIYKATLENLDIVYFVYDVDKDHMTINISSESGEYKQLVYDDYLENIEKIETIHPQFRRQLGMVFSRMIRRGGGKETFEYKNSFSGDGYQWTRIRMSEVKDAEGKLCRIIGRLDNIEKEMYHREEESRWKALAEKDSLTGLLSRNAGVTMIKDSVEKREGISGALFLIDVDDFKLINDTEGHLEGDRVLAKIAKALAGQFRAEDILCRYGGDEMLAFVPDMSDLNIIKKKSENILKAIEYIDTEQGRSPTCSIGISIKPSDKPISYEMLFRNADIALYSAKSNEKNCSYIFST